ncbi:PREDICTED: probable ribonuclease P/MRP protein subunit POP5 [Tarenaya hassleriana]|uniref:probable ribonuclease P/MRP protein subunit POP5 n=1 Tax=Tarenaya hassleriana TaxID=28532 RepID=UPI00053C34F1|nr:PREDICTED: probable ribonuclease P/MRP protein subunit POP5 [Tarenaya hassleriana]
MVAFKNRYLLMEVFLDPDKDLLGERSPINLTQLNLSEAIRESIRLNFGECGLGSSQGSFQVKYVNPITKVFIVRVSREDYRHVWSAMTMVRSVGNCRAVLNLLDLCGCIRACRETALKCEEAKFEQRKLMSKTNLTDEEIQRMNLCLERIKLLEN